MTKEERLKKRYRAEKRFQMYGLISVSCALIFVLILVQNIFSKGSSAFSRTMIEVQVNFDSNLLELDGPVTQTSLKDAEFYDTSKVDYHNIGKEIKKLEKLMRSSATDLDFEKAAFYRDLIKELKEKVLIKRA